MYLKKTGPIQANLMDSEIYKVLREIDERKSIISNCLMEFSRLDLELNTEFTESASQPISVRFNVVDAYQILSEINKACDDISEQIKILHHLAEESETALNQSLMSAMLSENKKNQM